MEDTGFQCQYFKKVFVICLFNISIWPETQRANEKTGWSLFIFIVWIDFRHRFPSWSQWRIVLYLVDQSLQERFDSEEWCNALIFPHDLIKYFIKIWFVAFKSVGLLWIFGKPQKKDFHISTFFIDAKWQQQKTQ